MLGEDHPVARIWTQRERQLLDVGNEVLRLSYIILGYSEGTTEAEVATADSMQPAKVQVKVCSVKVNDAAYNLPAGDVASGGITGDADTASRPQNAPAEDGQQLEDAADAMQPAKGQVKVWSVKVNDAAYDLPTGDVASGGITGDADPASRPQDAPAEGGQQREDEQPVAELQTAVTEYNMQPAVVQFCPDSSSSTAGTMPPAAKTVGNTASGGQPAPVKVATRHQVAAEVCSRVHQQDCRHYYANSCSTTCSLNICHSH